jgi:hypothetical protein
MEGDLVTGPGDADWKTDSSVGSHTSTTEATSTDPPTDGDLGVMKGNTTLERDG